MRIAAALPQAAALQLGSAQAGKPSSAPGPALLVGLPGGAGRIVPSRWQVLPVQDPATHTVQLRLHLPAGRWTCCPGWAAAGAWRSINVPCR